MNTPNWRIRAALLASGLAIGLLTGLCVNRAHAADESPLSVVESLSVGYNWGTVQKVYDNNNGVVCYTFTSGGDGSGISCIK